MDNSSTPLVVRNTILQTSQVATIKSSANSADTRCSTEGTRDPAVTRQVPPPSPPTPRMRQPTPPRPHSMRRRIPVPPGHHPQRSLSVDARLQSSSHHHLAVNNDSPQHPTFQQEQALFERKLKDDGVAIRKINKFGKSSLRYIKCTVAAKPSSQSVGAMQTTSSHRELVLSWGRKKEIQMDSFISVIKGKSTERALKSNVPADQIVSLFFRGETGATESLDIEAPTRLDRDKFARAFARFLKIPLDGASETTFPATEVVDTDTAPSQPPAVLAQRPSSFSLQKESSPRSGVSFSNNSPPIREEQPKIKEVADDDEQSALSDLTGHGYDQEIVEELHHALTDLRSQLEESRAEAARAVKVAEQAIQSAERSESTDWQNTVTHKAAEAAALAQKRSAAALSQQRLAEERLGSEKRAAGFWRAQAEVAEEEAGVLHTRAAAAEVQRAAMAEQLQYERRLASDQISLLKSRITNEKHKHALEEALERNRALEIELDAARRDLESRPIEAPIDETTSPRTRKNFLFGRRKKAEPIADNESLLARNIETSCSNDTNDGELPTNDQVLKVQAETKLMKEQFELLRRCTNDQLQQLPMSAELWGEQVSHALKTSQKEVQRLQERLAIESASRRKLLHEVQDLRGTIRVYCRPKPGKDNGCLVIPSQDTILLKEEAEDEVGTSFEFDGVFLPETMQKEVYNEIEEVCLSVLDGYRICLMALGPNGCGKTCTLFGERSQESFTVTNHGVQFLTCQQLFKVAQERTDRFKDKFLLTVAEVYDERLSDVLALTPTGVLKGEEVSIRLKPNKRKSKQQEDDSTKQSKLEIRTDIHGDTVVQGLTTVEVTCFEDVSRVWTECLEARALKAEELGIEPSAFESNSHIIATLKVHSTNITTGITSLGQVQFADLAAAEVVAAEVSETSGPTRDWRFSNRSLEALCSVVESRIRFDRSVPFRTSTLTHLLRDSFEADTKVIVIACISEERLVESAATLRFASRMRRVNIGKATRHTVSPP